MPTACLVRKHPSPFPLWPLRRSSRRKGTIKLCVPVDILTTFTRVSVRDEMSTGDHALHASDWAFWHSGQRSTRFLCQSHHQPEGNLSAPGGRLGHGFQVGTQRRPPQHGVLECGFAKTSLNKSLCLFVLTKPFMGCTRMQKPQTSWSI